MLGRNPRPRQVSVVAVALTGTTGCNVTLSRVP